MSATWLLLRGLVREQRHWGGFERRLAEKTGTEPICLDLPGTGTEHRRSSPRRLAAITDDVRARVPSGAGRFAVFGVSLGGMVALDWAARYPDDLARVVVCNTSAGDLGRPWQRLRRSAWSTVVRAAATTDARARERLVLGLVADGRGVDLDRVAREWAEIATSAPVARAVLLRQLLAASRSRAPSSLPMPVDVLLSEGDRLVDPECSRQIARRLGVEPEVHPWGGHDLPLDDPDWVIARLLRAASPARPRSSAAPSPAAR